jgi:hypothetical protein
MATNEISNSNWAGGRIGGQIFSVGPLLPPSSVTGTTATTNYPAYGVLSIANTAAGTYLVELEQPAADAELLCNSTLHGSAPAGTPQGTLIATWSMPAIGAYPSINGGTKDQTNFRQVQFSLAATGVVTALAATTYVDFMFTHLPFAGQQ